jgi:spore maturation protein B
VLFAVISYAFWKRQDAYGDFIRGAEEGLRTAVQLLPTLVGLMMAVGILRASGFLDWISGMLEKLLSGTGFPCQLVPLAIVRLFSASAATGFLLDIFKEYGPDSRLGLTASLMLSCTETVFYTMSVYFMSVKVTRTRYTLAGALFAAFAGLAASIFLGFC